MIKLGHVPKDFDATLPLSYGGTTEMQETTLFEQNFASLTGQKHCVATSSGTGALFTIFLNLLDTPQEDKPVWTSPLTYMATVNVLKILGYEIHYADVDEDSFGLNLDRVQEHTGPDDAIMPVHLLGYPCQGRADKGRLVIDDACEAVGSTLRLGVASAWSFYPSHTIGIGEMGAITTNDNQLSRRFRLIKDNGRDRTAANAFEHHLFGLNFKSNDIMAAMANIQLSKLGEIVAKRKAAAKFYSDTIGFGPFNRDCAYLGYPLVFDTQRVREKVAHALAGKVEFRRMFPLVYDQPAMSEERRSECPVAEKISHCGLYIPCHQYLTQADLDTIVGIIRENLD